MNSSTRYTQSYEGRERAQHWDSRADLVIPRRQEYLEMILSVIADAVITDDRDDVRVIDLGAVAPVPFRAVEAEQAIKGRPIDSSNAEAAAEASVAGAVPLSENAYKVAITRTLVKRALVSGLPLSS